MNDPQNSQFNQNFFGSSDPNQPKTYEYVFSNHDNQPTPPPKKNGSGAWKILLTVVLCAAVSFTMGFGGAFAAYVLLGNGGGDGIVDAPSNNDLYQSNPSSILDKQESSASIYGSAGEEVFQVSQVVSRVQDAVVVIDATVTGSSFFGQTQTSTSAGSGVIISPEGYILTCHHVVDNATSVTVTLNSGSRYQAALVGSDEASDLAVLRIQPKESEPLVWAEQGCSKDLVVGEVVVAIGNPLGTLGGTVTDGIISATERNITTSDGTKMTLLQTNAAINSGNSGGGLFNLDGKLVGIVNAKYAAEGVEGLAFAIPIDSAYTVELDLIEYGYVRGVVDHGLVTLDVTESTLNSYYYRYKISKIGVYVVSSKYESAIQNKDRIVSVNGTEITTTQELEGLMESLAVGDTVRLVLERNNEQFTIDLVLREYVPDGIASGLQ